MQAQQLQNLSTSSRTFECLINNSSHNAYATLLHMSTTREAGIASPQTMEEAPAGNYFTQSPAATEVETASSPWPEEEAPTGFPGGLHAAQQQSHQQSASESRLPNPPGSKTKCRWNPYRWTFSQMNISYEHFCNDCNITKQAS